MKISELKVGDRVRITAVPGEGIPNYRIQPETVRAYKELIARGRSVRIYDIDEYGHPWFQFQFRSRNGAWEYHSMCIMQDDENWVLVKPRKKSR